MLLPIHLVMYHDGLLEPPLTFFFDKSNRQVRQKLQTYSTGPRLNVQTAPFIHRVTKNKIVLQQF